MKDDTLNLDSNLFPKNSPYVAQQQVSAFAFDYQNEAGIISSAKIRNASIGTAQISRIDFNIIEGGTATLGGSANGDGVLLVNNSSGSNVVTIDNQGVTVTDGSISIKNSGGTTVLDSTGLNSLNNFESGGATGQAGTLTSTSYTQWPGLTVTTSNFTRSRNVLMFCGMSFAVDSVGGTAANGFANMVFNVDNSIPAGLSTFSRQFQRQVAYTDGVQMQYSMFYHYMSMGTGTHTIQVMAQCDIGGLNIVNTNGAARLTYVVLGT